ncbi:hypothetical protein EDB89DRAFT_64591 [Lactarius sanguifluus]|nr:hypothetical protein EDB89DRAFT_64591 [Lactarius sanguifluus]
MPTLIQIVGTLLANRASTTSFHPGDFIVRRLSSRRCADVAPVYFFYLHMRQNRLSHVTNCSAPSGGWRRNICAEPFTYIGVDGPKTPAMLVTVTD